MISWPLGGPRDHTQEPIPVRVPRILARTPLIRSVVVNALDACTRIIYHRSLLHVLLLPALQRRA